MPSELMYQIALTRVPMIGDITIRKLLDYFPTATDIFTARLHELEKIEQVGSVKARAIKHFKDFESIEKELAFITDNDIQVIFYRDENYPGRLRNCVDAPALLYFKGNASLNTARMVSIVGTRQPSPYGVKVCGQLVKELCDNGVTIVSGLAYGIDILSHSTAVAAKTPTIGVLAHGLDRIYPAVHQQVAESMQQCGGLLTDYPSNTLPDRQNFPKRNRIVAGLADATVVIESGIKGGSLITADLANGYNRDVFCVPGHVGEWYAAGCHELIRENKATLITGAADILTAMGWDKQAARPIVSRQAAMFVELSLEEQTIMQLFTQRKRLHLEEIYILSRLSGSQVAVAMFNLEMQCLVKCLPGQVYEPVI
ncbi:DNA-processing protein DprA [Chitinophaga sp. sic0106]|uniref:DNA-processing protein DprA n=1 Tax=Chitinophaga sp. sic0106 TaxID=2854785 RepID=UPI001C48B4B2|nr:DNA-processing protein DprA [Chitinophaga sp. sic0106]MBV7533371.1 DNA-processing protein DprA [Chitinophaga sp. sic0106]